MTLELVVNEEVGEGSDELVDATEGDGVGESRPLEDALRDAKEAVKKEEAVTDDVEEAEAEGDEEGEPEAEPMRLNEGGAESVADKEPLREGLVDAEAHTEAELGAEIEGVLGALNECVGMLEAVLMVAVTVTDAAALKHAEAEEEEEPQYDTEGVEEAEENDVILRVPRVL